ncbi:MAG: hypothetical protein ACI4HI_07695 [Lachnospiraceae bacterium]
MQILKHIKVDFMASFFRIRMVIAFLFHLIYMHYQIQNLHVFCEEASYPPAPWILPFLCATPYFPMLYGCTMLYFFSDTPFLQYREMYSILRLGRKRWVLCKLARLWLSALAFTLMETVASVCMFGTWQDWTTDWGKVYQTLAQTDAGTTYGISISVSKGLLDRCTPLQAMAETMLILFLVTGMFATMMFVLGMVSRYLAIGVGAVLAVVTIVALNVDYYLPWLYCVSPFSWMNANLMHGVMVQHHPVYGYCVLFIVIFTVVASVISCRKIEHLDIHWVREE